MLLSDLSYELGIIGLAEYEERLTVAGWLSRPDGESLDPRGDPPGEPDAHPEPREPREGVRSPDSSGGLNCHTVTAWRSSFATQAERTMT